jgi:2-keto-4-pentenoate hydratase/2-oxohepta-3-ene-1,7-dioic acid hydratase in catechol pathway
MEKVICVGKNYPLHAEEMGDGLPEWPVVFFKPPSVCTYMTSTTKEKIQHLPWLDGWDDVNYECEVVFRLGINTKNAQELNAIKKMEDVFTHFTLGLDLTKRSLQAQLKKKGHPWELAKSFWGSCIVGPWMDIKAYGTFKDQPFHFLINDQLKQKGFIHQMVKDPLDCIRHVGKHIALKEGDLFFSGTPEGVGPLHPQDQWSFQWKDWHHTAQFMMQ